MLRSRARRPLWLTSSTAADDAGESEFINEFYPVAVRLASGIGFLWPGVLPCADLTQHGVIAALGLYRRLGGRPAPGLAYTAAYREMLDVLRTAARRQQLRFEINGEGADPADARLDLAAIDRRIDAGRLLRLAGSSRDRFALAAHACGFTFDEIGAALGVTGGRVHQCNKAAIARIQRLSRTGIVGDTSWPALDKTRVLQ